MDRSSLISRFTDALENATDLVILDMQFLSLIHINDLIRDMSNGSLGMNKYLVIYKGKILSIYVDFNGIEIVPIKDSFILNRLQMKDNLRNYIWIGMK